MANNNNAHGRLKLKAKRRRREVERFIQRCAASNRQAEEKGIAPQDFSKEIRAFKTAMK
jgi:hypothetical protein